MVLPLVPVAANADEAFRPWFDAGIEFPLTPVGQAADFSNCGNWLVYSNSRPGAPEAKSIRVNVIDSSSENPAEWTRVATLSLESELGFTLPAQARDIAFHPQHDAFAVTHAATNNEDGIAFFDASDPDPENWQQVQFGDLTLWPRPEGTSLEFTADGAFLAVGMAISTLDDDFNFGWDVFDTSDPDPANWDFSDVRPSFISGDDALGGTARDVAFSPDGDLLVFVHHTEQEDNSDQHITVINSSGDEWFGLFNQPNVSGRAWAVDFHPSGEWFVVTHDDGIDLFEADTLNEVSDFDIGASGTSVQFSSDGDILAVSYFNEVGDEGIRWIDSSSANPSDWAIDDTIGPTDLPSAALSITFSSDDEYVAMAHRNEPYATVAQRLQSPSGPRDVSASYVEGSFDMFLNEGDIAISWQHPEFDGGGGIDRYELRSADGAFDDLVLDATETSAVVTFDYTELADTGLVPVELLAVGQANLEGPVVEAAAVLPTVPGPVSDLEPVGLDVDGIVATWQFTWQAPADDGGTAVTGYRVRTELASGGQNLFEVDEPFIEVDFELDGGEISVAAENDFGESARVSTDVPALTAPVLADGPVFQAVRAVGDSHFEVDVQVSAVDNWGFVGDVEAEPGEYVFTYQAVGGPIEVVREGGSGAAEIVATLTVAAEDLSVAESVSVEARNDYGLASSPQSTDIPVFIDSIEPLSDLAASQPTWEDAIEAYVTSVSWADYHPFASGQSALALLEGGDVPTGTVTVVVTNSPPAAAPTTDNNTDLPLDNASAPEFGDAEAIVNMEGVGQNPLVSPAATVAVADVGPPPLPAVTLVNQRFSGAVLEHDLSVQPAEGHSAPIAEVETIALDDGVNVELASEGNDVFSGTLSVDLEIADYTSPVVGEQHPAASLRLVDAATLSGESALAEVPAVPAPEAVAIIDYQVSFEEWEATISLELAIDDLEVTGPTEEFIVTLDDVPVPAQPGSGSADQPTIEIEAQAGDLLSDTLVTVARRSITEEVSEPAETTISAAESGLSLEKELTDAPETIEVGSELEYTLTARNVGEVALVDVEISDEKITPDSAACDDLEPEASCELVGTYTVTQDDVDAGEVINTGSAQAQAADGQTVEAEEATVQTPVEGESSVAIEKVLESSASFVEVGETVTYTITVTNTGTVTLTDVLVNDDMISPSSEQCEHLAPGDHCVLEGEYVVTEADAEEGFIVNQAVAKADGLDEVGAEHIIAVGEGIHQDRFSIQ